MYKYVTNRLLLVLVITILSCSPAFGGPTWWGSSGFPNPTIIVGSGNIDVSNDNTIVICTDAATITLPPVEKGFTVCVRNSPGMKQALTIMGRDGEYFESPEDGGGWGTIGGSIVSTTTTEDNICLVGQDSSHWIITSMWGLWTNNPPVPAKQRKNVKTK